MSLDHKPEDSKVRTRAARLEQKFGNGFKIRHTFKDSPSSPTFQFLAPFDSDVSEAVLKPTPLCCFNCLFCTDLAELSLTLGFG